jgi:hypothetical protein
VKVIHLYRRNMLKQAVSLIDAEMSHVWTVEAKTTDTASRLANRRKRARHARLTATQVMHAFLHFFADWHISCRFIQKVFPGPGSPPALELAYEDLSSLHRRRATLGRVYHFLGIETTFSLEAFSEARKRQSHSEAALNLSTVMQPGEDVKLIRLLAAQPPYKYLTLPYNALTQGLSDDAFIGGSISGSDALGLGDLGQC